MNVKYYLLSVIMVFFFWSCADTGPGNLSGCCEKDALDVTFGLGRLFVPNIFTPNQDGVDDRLFPRGDSISQILDFVISDFRGDVVFETHHTPPNDKHYGWDGHVNGKLLQGLYSFSITAESIDGTTVTYAGETCNFPCGIVDVSSADLSLRCYSGMAWDCYHYYDDCNEIELTNCQ
jgi:hypothetical protein